MEINLTKEELDIILTLMYTERKEAKRYAYTGSLLWGENEEALLDKIRKAHFEIINKESEE